MINIAVFASGTGSNFKNLINRKDINANFSLLVCDKKKANVINIANKNNIKTFVFSPKDYQNKEDYENHIIEELEKNNIDLIVLAGYMRILSKKFVKKYENKIINIHPSYLPYYKGAKAITDAYEDGKNIFGVTVHYVNEEVDGGKIIIQEKLENTENLSIEEITEKIHNLEYKLYPYAIKMLLN